jgi:peroxiredoxin
VSDARAALLTTLLAATLPAAAAAPRSLVAPAGAPELLRVKWIVLHLMTAEELGEQVARFGERTDVEPLRRIPDDLGTDARFCMPHVDGAGLLSIAVIPRDGGFEARVDRNMNGTLESEERFVMTRSEKAYELSLKDPVPVAIGIDPASVQTEGGPPRDLYFYATTVRMGRVPVGRRSLAFALLGDSGRYGDEGQPVYLDLDGDGRFAFDDWFSAERFEAADRLVRIGRATYEIAVDRRGDSLTLTRSSHEVPERAFLDVGRPAPDFRFVDLEGHSGRLRSFRGKTVLLNFWGSWCGPCVAEAGELASIYRRRGQEEFEILGIPRDTDDAVRAFATERGLAWRQVREADAAAIHRLFRVSGWPSHFLIGPDGKILDRWSGGGTGRLAERLDAAGAARRMP